MLTLRALLLLFVSTVAAQKGLTAQVFALSSASSSATNAKLAWSVDGSSATSYTVQRKTGSNSYATIGTVAGNSFDDYGLIAGTSYTYQVSSSTGKSNEASVQALNVPSGYSNYTNTQTSTLRRQSRIKANGVYYQYNYIEPSTGHFYVQQQTSQDGYAFSGNVSVLDSGTVCASIEGKSCHLERTSFTLNPSTGNVVMWAHLENTDNYNLAQVAAANGKPGSKFTFDGTYRPLGHDSRDLGFFADDNGAAYLISATDTNTNLNIYSLTSNWTAIASLANTVAKNEYREAPAMIKVNNVYYLFTSRASGWYPSTPNIITSTSITGSWSAAKIPTNIATFASQSGTVDSLGSGWGMLGDRWAANWVPADGENREYLLPVSFASDSSGYAFYHWYQSVLYQDPQGSVVGVQRGRVLSQGKAVSTTPAGGSNISLSVDGMQNNPDRYFTPKSVPFTWVVDLGQAYTIGEVDWATRMVQGSETYYQFTVAGSADNKTWTTIADQTKNTAVGFVPSVISAGAKYRYVNVSVSKVINTHNGNEADSFAGVIEGVVLGY